MQFPNTLKPYKGVIFFVIALLSAHFFWKFTVIGDESGDRIIFLGLLDISQPFIFMAEHVANICYSILKFIGFNINLLPNNILRFENGHGVQVVWACTGIKQAFIFTMILAFARGCWKYKLWYIPFGLICIYLFNIFRIVFITSFVEKHPEWFDLLHEHLLKYLFYIMIFFIWVYWEEKLADKSKTKCNKNDKET
ncbi:MAG: exosortase/archaeosortase family protein [Paludibacteraceae bacterium]